jgi:tetratricopeptide (TPR) repeat protein
LKKSRHAVRIALLWIVIAAAYSNSFQAALVFDNIPAISQDPRIREVSATNLHEIVAGQYWFNNTTSGLYRPLTTLSYLFNYAIVGNADDPAGYHVVNLLIHLANVAMVYVLGLVVLGDWWALALAALWGLHPVLVESVTNIVGRADLLAAFGVLGGLLCAIFGTRPIWLLWLALFQAIGLFSKESAAVLPAIILLYDLAFAARIDWRKRAVQYAILLIPFAIFFWMRAATKAHLLVNPAENPLISASFWTARLTAVKVIGLLNWLFLAPLHLSADYSYNAVPLGGPGCFLALAICAAGIAGAIVYRRKWPAVFFFVLFFFVVIAPTSNVFLIIGSIMAERFLYLPAVGLAGCVVFALSRFRYGLAAAGMICALLGIRTYIRNFDWADGVSLWSSAVEVSPNAARAHNNLAFEYSRIPGRMADAIAEYQVALKIRPDYPEAHFNLGNALLAVGKPADAIAQFRAAVQAAPLYAEAHNNLGNAMLQAGDAAGIAEIETAGRLSPEFAGNIAAAHDAWGQRLLQAGKGAEAIAEFQAAIRARPNFAQAHANLGSAFLSAGRPGDAIAEYRTATQLDPRMADAHFNLGNALLQLGRVPEAIAEFEAVLKIHPDAEVAGILERLRGRH